MRYIAKTYLKHSVNDKPKQSLTSIGHLMWRADSFEKTLMPGQEEKGTTEDETAGWHHRLDGHEPG